VLKVLKCYFYTERETEGVFPLSKASQKELFTVGYTSREKSRTAALSHSKLVKILRKMTVHLGHCESTGALFHSFPADRGLNGRSARVGSRGGFTGFIGSRFGLSSRGTGSRLNLCAPDFGSSSICP